MTEPSTTPLQHSANDLKYSGPYETITAKPEGIQSLELKERRKDFPHVYTWLKILNA